MAWGWGLQAALPVVPRGNKKHIVGASIQRSHMWHHVEVLHLTENMHVDLMFLRVPSLHNGYQILAKERTSLQIFIRYIDPEFIVELKCSMCI